MYVTKMPFRLLFYDEPVYSALFLWSLKKHGYIKINIQQYICIESLFYIYICNHRHPTKHLLPLSLSPYIYIHRYAISASIFLDKTYERGMFTAQLAKFKVGQDKGYHRTISSRSDDAGGSRAGKERIIEEIEGKHVVWWCWWCCCCCCFYNHFVMEKGATLCSASRRRCCCCYCCRCLFFYKHLLMEKGLVYMMHLLGVIGDVILCIHAEGATRYYLPSYVR